METVTIYFLKSSGLIGLFFLAYYLLLKRETFFNSNRWFLLAGLFSSAALPFLVFTKINWIEPTPTNIDWSTIPVTTSVVKEEGFEINWYYILGIVYIIGIIILIIKLLMDLYSLKKVLKNKAIQQQSDFKFINVSENIAPFSFFNYIVYNTSLYNESELENILEHEKVHCAQNHTIDVLVSRLFCVAFWFNPFIWLYKKAMVQNLEFIADNEASKKLADKKAYQMTLLKITTHENCVAITNHFYQSLIKKRIIMLNKNQSNQRNSWKYATIIPVLVAFVFLFQIEVVAQEKTTVKQKNEVKEPVDLTTLSKEKEIYVDGKKSTQEELSKLNKDVIDKVDVNSSKNTISITTKTTTEEKPLIEVNGQLMENDFDTKTLDPTKIKSTKVLRGIQATGNYGVDHPYVIKIRTSDKNYNPDLEEALFIIDGKETDHQAFLNLRGKVKEIKVTDARIYEGTPDANKRATILDYGLKAKNGVMFVKTIPLDKNHDKEVNSWKVSAIPAKEGIKQDVANQTKIKYYNSVIIIDGKTSNNKEFNSLNPDEIAFIKVQKVSEEEQKVKDEKVKQYGEKALNGIIEIQTKTLFK